MLDRILKIGIITNLLFPALCFSGETGERITEPGFYVKHPMGYYDDGYISRSPDFDKEAGKMRISPKDLTREELSVIDYAMKDFIRAGKLQGSGPETVERFRERQDQIKQEIERRRPQEEMDRMETEIRLYREEIARMQQLIANREKPAL